MTSVPEPLPITRWSIPARRPFTGPMIAPQFSMTPHDAGNYVTYADHVAAVAAARAEGYEEGSRALGVHAREQGRLQGQRDAREAAAVRVTPVLAVARHRRVTAELVTSILGAIRSAGDGLPL